MRQTLLGFIRKEFVQVLRDTRMRIVLFVVPIVQLTLFGLALSTEVRNISLAASVAPDDVVALRLLERAYASKRFIPAALSSGNAADAVFIPPPGGLTEALGRYGTDAGTSVQLLVDASNSVRARSVEAYFRAILAETLSDYSNGAQTVVSPVRLDVRVLFNPSMESAVFMVPGILSMILCLVTVILTSMSIAREKEIGTFETLISTPVSVVEVLLGKTIPYVVLGMIEFPLVIGVAVFGFGVPFRGPIALVALAGFLFIVATVAIGTLISTFARNQQQAMMGGFLFLFPAMLMSGMMFPLDNMPKLIGLIAWLNPLKYFVAVLRNLMLKGGDAFFVFWNFTALIVLTAVAVMFATRRFKTTL